VSGGPKVALVKTISQNTVAGTVDISWSASAAPFDNAGFYNTSNTTQIVAPVTGAYKFAINVGSSSTDTRSLGYKVNGGSLNYFSSNSGQVGAASHTGGNIVLQLNAGDTVVFTLLSSTAAEAIANTITTVSAELLV
jgi:C1q domain.